jgi:ABC-type glycerol-3-phosphate transport system permease component
MQNHSHFVFAVLYLKDQKKTFTILGIAITIESIYCSRSPLIVASIVIACQVNVIIYVFKVE